MSYKLRPKYINSPSWREGGKEVLGWIAIYAFFLILFVTAMMLTGGDR